MGKITRNEFSDVLNAELDSYVRNPGVATTTNAGNDYAITLNPVPTEYENGMGLILTINADSTGNATINVNDLGAIPIKKANGNPVNNLKANGVYSLRYSSAQLAFILMGEGGEYGNATQSDVIEGKTIGTENGIVTGSIPLRLDGNGDAGTGLNHHLASNFSKMPGTVFLKPNPKDHSRVAYEGDCWVSYNDASFHPDNIIKGKPIFGMEGNIPNYGRAALGQGYIYPESYLADGGGSLVIEPKWGYYEAGKNNNGFGSIMITDPNYIHSSILKGKSIFGLAGTAEPKLKAEILIGSMGSGYPGSNYPQNVYQDYTVSGYGFTPTLIVLKGVGNDSKPVQSSYINVGGTWYQEYMNTKMQQFQFVSTPNATSFVVRVYAYAPISSSYEVLITGVTAYIFA